MRKVWVDVDKDVGRAWEGCWEVWVTVCKVNVCWGREGWCVGDVSGGVLGRSVARGVKELSVVGSD